MAMKCNKVLDEVLENMLSETYRQKKKPYILYDSFKLIKSLE